MIMTLIPKMLLDTVRHCIPAKLLSATLLFSALHATSVQAAVDDMVFFQNDHLGSAIAAVNEYGDLCWSETYTPYGDKTVEQDVGIGMPDGCGLLGQERGYTGHTDDFESGLTYAQQRYYDPTMGRFLSVDPMAINPFDQRTINRYAYAANNPYRYTDPDGRNAVTAIGGFFSELWEGLTGSGDGEANLSKLPGAFVDGYNGEGDGSFEALANDVTTLGGGVAILGSLLKAKKLYQALVKSKQKSDVTKNVVDSKRTKHIFRDKEGHLPDTPENRKLLEGVADNPKTTLGNDKFGNTWSAQKRSDGTQVWTQTRNGKIINGGVNSTPRSFDPNTGLSAPTKPR